MQLLFVCTGNICRSPTAERLAVAYGRRMLDGNVFVSSAGIRAVVGHPIHREAIEVLEQLGGDADGFCARQLTARIASRADFIVTMTRAHRDAVLELAPGQLRRTFMLAEVAELKSKHGADTVADLSALRSRLSSTDVLDVPDPIGQDRTAYEQAGATIAKLLPPVIAVCASSVGSAAG